MATKMTVTALKSCMAPIARPDARLFILGSLPGDASLAAQRYYAHPTNQFWRLLGETLDEPLGELDYAARLHCLARRAVGLWDVVAVAERSGSLDAAIRKAVANPLERLIADFPLLGAIAFNGGAAARAGRRLLGSPERIELIDLPSSSAAFTRPFAYKAAKWRELARYCDPGFSPLAKVGRVIA